MDRSKLRISKACEECRLRKIRCDGGEPCQRCQFRDVVCEYRTKARNRTKKSDLLGAGANAGRGSDGGNHSSPRSHPRRPASGAATRPADTPSSASGGRNSSLQNHSVAATHRASPSVFLQLYYGPSSNFSLLNAIYHRIEGRTAAEARRRKAAKANGAHGEEGANGGGTHEQDEQDDDRDDEDEDDDHDEAETTREVEEFGPGLDLFNNRRLYFGDLTNGAESSFNLCGNGSFTDGASMFIDRALAERLLERYLATFWLVLPIWTRDTFRQRLAGFYDATSLLTEGDPDTVIVLLALALGATMLEEELAAQYLYRMAQRWAVALDEMVNVSTVQIALMMSHYASERARPNSSFLLVGTAVRKAVAAGLHKGVGGSGRGHAAKQSPEAARQMRVTVWSLFFWETWLCFSLGRPSSFPESEMDVPFPTEEKLLHNVVTLARIMSKSAASIYRRHHDSLLTMWNAANDIRRELRAFAEQLREDFNFGVIDDPTSGEVGVRQTIVSTLYHHTLILTFRPFLVIRATLLREDSEGAGQPHPPPPRWLDTACEYCLDAARHSIAFLIRAFEKNEMCRAIRYHLFFIEGASQVLAFEILHHDAAGRESNLPWIQLAIRALQLVLPKHKVGRPLPVDLPSNLERMVQVVYPDFRADQVGTGTVLPGIPSIQAMGRTTTTTAGAAAAGATNVCTDTATATATTTATATASSGSMGDHDMTMTDQESGSATADPLYGTSAPSTGAGAGSSGMTAGAPPSSFVPQHQLQQYQYQQRQQQQQHLVMNPLPPTMPDMGGGGLGGGGPLDSSGQHGGGATGANTNTTTHHGGHFGSLHLTDLSSLSNLSNALPPLLFPFTPFGGLDDSSATSAPPGHNTTGTVSMQSPHGPPGSGGGAGAAPGSSSHTPDAPGTGSGDAPPLDLTAADLGWDFDFGTMNMEAFLSIDPTMPYNY
ncbi:hypothetical protein HMPREF1624_07626 [Sporothrix schenckii ATCC 58251]|uniref:Zn(2)-C6 fungal-type domain-containing protein n=1 Tax=Sporothrix schenckii (strain ATCC 58251 / de Perez 2211183) TaxID=1391915 RepID=U7PNM2_SPOS1|nr:hypothetical protein HMPREF1624_07626 [Sporothrix schenckii ATCC 58251]